jgi:hypothetical protein
VWWESQEEWDVLGLELVADVDNGLAGHTESADPTQAL